LIGSSPRQPQFKAHGHRFLRSPSRFPCAWHQNASTSWGC